MAVGLGTRQAADEEARAEVEVINSRLEKTRILNAKLAASLQRLQTSGNNVQNAMGPLAGNTMELRVVTKNIDSINQAIERIRQPSDANRNEEEIIRKGPGNGQLSQHLESVQRLVKSLAELQQTKLRSNKQRVAETIQMLKMGNSQLENYFRQLLQAESGVDGLEDYAQNFVAKNQAFPVIRPDTLNQLSPINQHMAAVPRQNAAYAGSPMMQAYADVRGPYLKALLAGMAFQSANQKKRNQDEIYKAKSNTIGYYTKAMQGAFLAEYQNICELFKREEWSQTFNVTTQGAISELAQTLRTLDAYTRANLNTECFLAYEIIEAVSTMSEYLVERTGELKTSFSAALKPVRETGKSSLKKLLDDMGERVMAIQNIPADGAPLPITNETITRLQSMTNFLGPLSSLMLSIGDSGWKDSTPSKSSFDQGPNLNSFDVSADGIQIFINYCFDTIAKLLEALNNRASILAKNKSVAGVFILNNISVVERIIKGSELKPLLESSPRMNDLEDAKKRALKDYAVPWIGLSRQLMDSVHTNRGARPTSGSASAVDSILMLKSLNSKEKDSIKDKFKNFNEQFGEQLQKNKLLAMEKDVKTLTAREVQQTIEPMYIRFLERYQEIDKGRGKYIKYDRAAMSAIMIGLAS